MRLRAVKLLPNTVHPAVLLRAHRSITTVTTTFRRSRHMDSQIRCRVVNALYSKWCLIFINTRADPKNHLKGNTYGLSSGALLGDSRFNCLNS